jgi:hypothetical protein
VTDLTLICETCRFPINGDTGCIYAPFSEMRSPGIDVRWRTSHYAHFPQDEGDTYQIDAGRIATWRQLAWWTAHLMEKAWFPRSDWNDLLRELGGDETPRRIREAA